MALSDEIKAQRDTMKEAPLKKKFEYYFGYYKVPVIVTAISIVIVISVIQSIVSKADTIYTGAFVNASSDVELTEVLNEELMEIIGTEGVDEEASFDTTYFLDYVNEGTNHATSLQKIVTLVAVAGVETIVADEETYVQLAYLGYFTELESLFTDEELEAYEGQIYYIDQVVMDEIASLGEEMASEELYPEYIFGDAEDMEEPIAVGIYASEESKLSTAFGYIEGAVIGAVVNTTHQESAVAFMKLALEE